MAKAKRTTRPSSKAEKLCTIRDSQGCFTDIHTYERAHRADVARAPPTQKGRSARKGAQERDARRVG
jgi:hypothetical protein